MNYAKLHEELIKGFIRYQWDLENPSPAQYVPSPNISMPPWDHKYREDPIFRNKVRSLVAGVTSIVQKVEEQTAKGGKL